MGARKRPVQADAGGHPCGSADRANAGHRNASILQARWADRDVGIDADR